MTELKIHNVLPQESPRSEFPESVSFLPPGTPRHKECYQAPTLQVYQYVVEHGFANSVKSRGMTDTYSEINDAGTGSGHDGENYTGMWDVEWN